MVLRIENTMDKICILIGYGTEHVAEMYIHNTCSLLPPGDKLTHYKDCLYYFWEQKMDCVFSMLFSWSIGLTMFLPSTFFLIILVVFYEGRPIIAYSMYKGFQINIRTVEDFLLATSEMGLLLPSDLVTLLHINLSDEIFTLRIIEQGPRYTVRVWVIDIT